MAQRLDQKIGEMEYDGLITDTSPAVITGPGVLAGLDEDTVFKRGTVLAKSEKTGALYLLGTKAEAGDTLTADSILTDDVTVTAKSSAPVVVYLAGRFNPDKLTVADEYAITEADKDALRVRGILLKAASEI
jgi:hypothetical protein